MSLAPTGLHDCPDIQAELDSYFETCDASLLPDPAPLNEFLWSGANRSGIQQILTPGSNKVRNLVLRYDQRIVESEVDEVDSCERTCTATTKRGDLTKSYEIDTCDKLRIEELMNAEDFKLACRGNFEIVNKKIRLMLNALQAKVATKMTGLAVGYVGAWPQIAGNVVGGTQLQVATTKATSHDINPKAIEEIDFAIQAAGYCNSAAIFAGRTLYQYMRLMDKGCCSAQGLDLSELMSAYGKAVMWDRRLQAEMDADSALSIGLKALQPVYYVRNNDGLEGLVGVGANYQKQVIYDYNGLPVDLTISDNCGDISIIMETVVDLKALPADMFAPGDYMEAVNWVNEIKVVNPA